MKRINTILNDFLKTAPYWKVYIFWALFIGIFSLFFSTIMYEGLGMEDIDKGDGRKMLNYLCLFFAIFFGSFLTFTTHTSRISDRFWKLAEDIETKLAKTNTKAGLESLLKYEFDDLYSLCNGYTQQGEIKRLKAILETKKEYVL